MGKKRKTKKQKIKAKSRRYLLFKQVDKRAKRTNNQARFNNVSEQLAKTKKKQTEVDILTVPARLINQDLLKTLVLSIIFIVLIIILYWFFEIGRKTLFFL